jgi:hypothetical protein
MWSPVSDSNWVLIFAGRQNPRASAIQQWHSLKQITDPLVPWFSWTTEPLIFCPAKAQVPQIISKNDHYFDLPLIEQTTFLVDGPNEQFGTDLKPQ